MEDASFLIIGAGPAGLACAHRLRELGHQDLLVLEQAAEAGGLCRSVVVDGAPLDTGGGHFLDVRNQRVLDLLFRFLPAEEWNSFDRISPIRLHDMEVDYPLEANIWQLPAALQVDYLESIANAGCVKGEPMPERFEEWIQWKLGGEIARNYMLPYNRKIWSMDLNALGTYWLYKLPEVSFRETLESCLMRESRGRAPAHARFFYPKKHGYGEVWRRMADDLGDRVRLNTPVTAVDPDARTVNGSIRYRHLINTAPWQSWTASARLPEAITACINQLKHSSIDVTYHAETLPTRAHWLYDPSEEKDYHRILVRHNFVPGARGYWTEGNSVRSSPARGFRHHNAYAYPLNTLGKPQAITTILEWGRSLGIWGLGRWGEWEHMNSDVAVDHGLKLADQLHA